MTTGELRLKLAEFPDDTLVLLVRDDKGGQGGLLSIKTIVIHQVRGEPWCGFSLVGAPCLDPERYGDRGRAYMELEQEQKETALVISPYEAPK